MTNPEELVERMARAIELPLASDSELYWAAEYGRPVPEDSTRKLIEAALASLPGSGWRLVPEVPTEEMVRVGEHAGWDAINSMPMIRGVQRSYTAMIAASPLPPSVSGGE